MIACQAQFDVADGYTVPTELVLVPMLFLLPTPVVPLIVSLCWTLGRLLDFATGRISVYRAFHVFGDCWHAVGPALVLIVAGAQVFSWDAWPVYALALVAQIAFDFAATTIRANLIEGTSPRTELRLLAPGLRAGRRPRADRPARRLRVDRDRPGDLPARHPARRRCSPCSPASARRGSTRRSS